VDSPYTIKRGAMKIIFAIVSILLSFSGIAQPHVTVTYPNSDTTILLPVGSFTLTGSAIQANPGHPVKSTTWAKTSGPAATITDPSSSSTTVTGMALGNYEFTFTASDKKGSASASVKVKVLSGLLPVELNYFHITHNSNGVLLSWRTDMESNISRFIIQKSVDGSIFTDLDSLDSKAKNGNSNTPLVYNYQISGKFANADSNYIFLVITMLAVISVISKAKRIYKGLILVVFCLFLFSCSKTVVTPDNINAVSTKSFYRLKLVNLDGQFTYSAIEKQNQ
jgi:hypothetical protein